MDPFLLPYLTASEPAESDRLLEQLVCEYADPGIRQVLRHKLRGMVNERGRSVQAQGGDIEDVYGEARLHVIARLAELKRDPAARPIGNFRGYVVAVAYNACHEYLRRKYPRRHSLKNQIRYRLEHHPAFACWQGNGPDWLCGFAAWRGGDPVEPGGRHTGRNEGGGESGDASGNASSDTSGHASGHGWGDAWRDARTGLVPDADRLDDVGLLTAIFTRSGSPIELDDLVTICASVRGISDATTSTTAVDEQRPGNEALETGREGDLVDELARRDYLRRAWVEIRQLLPRQRAALLLNLRDAQGGNALDLFVLVGVATIRQIARALEMEAKSIARLWNDLPLSDAVIAERLGTTRQQVINLRKSARERLARRLR